MSRNLTIVVVVMMLGMFTLAVSAPALADEAEAGAATPAGAGLTKPEDLATLSGLSYPGLRCTVQLDIDAGLLSMLRPVLEALSQSAGSMPPPLKDLGEALEKMGPAAGQAAQAITEFLAEVQGGVLTIQTPPNGEVNVPKVATYYLQRALSAGWKPVLRVNESPKESVAVFQLPSPASPGGPAEPPRGFVLAVVNPQQVIAAGVLARFDFGKLLPLLPILGQM